MFASVLIVGLLALSLFADCGQALTGNCYGDVTVGAAVAGLLVFVARHFGWTWLEKFAEAVLEKKKPAEGDGAAAPRKPPQGGSGTAPPQAGDDLVHVALDAAQPEGFQTLGTLGKARAETVAVPVWLAVLLQFVPTLIDLIRRLLGEEQALKGRPLTMSEKTAVAVRVGLDYRAGRLEAPEVRPAKMPDAPAN